MNFPGQRDRQFLNIQTMYDRAKNQKKHMSHP